MITKNLEKLKTLPKWVNFILYPRGDGSYSKPPINPKTLWNGSSTNPEQWTDYETAAGQVGKTATYKPKDGDPIQSEVKGVGFVMTGGYCGIDLDHVIDDKGKPVDFAKKLVEDFDSYTEYSPSGKGLHILLFASDLGEDLGGKYKVDQYGNLDKAGKYEVEIYAYKNGGGRYLTVTGNPYQDKEINETKGARLKEVYNSYRKQKEKKETTAPTVGTLPQADSDTAVLDKALGSAADTKIRLLFSGDTSAYNGDNSAADLALVNYLCYWANGNKQQIDRLFRASGLMRSKWDEKHGATTYGEMTIDKALADFTPYNPATANYSPYNSETGKTATIMPPNTEAPKIDPKRGLMTYEAAVKEFNEADDTFLNIEHFNALSVTAKIRKHDTVVIAADTGGGKSSLAINFIDDLNQENPVIYFNLEMDNITLLRRLVAIHTGITIDQVSGYQKDPGTRERVNTALKEITSRKPLQLINDAYSVEEIGDIIKAATAERKENTVVIIDHSLLMKTAEGMKGNYEKFTYISEELRRISIHNNATLLLLTQMNRESKKQKDIEPDLNALKESGSFENDATQVLFIWYDPTARDYCLLLKKNRNGQSGLKFRLYYNKTTQTMREALDAATPTQVDGMEDFG